MLFTTVNAQLPQVVSVSDSSIFINQLITESYKKGTTRNQVGLNYAISAIELSTRNNLKPLKLQATLAYIHNCYLIGKYDLIYKYDSILTSLSEDSVPIVAYFKACKSIGKFYHFTGNYSLALKFYLKGLLYFEKTNELVEVGELFNAIGGLYFKQKDFITALKYYTNSLHLFKKINDSKQIGRGFLNMACVNIEQNEILLSKTRLDSAKIYYTKVNFKIGIGFVFASIGDMYIKNGKSNKALSNLIEAHTIMLKEKQLYSLAEIKLSIIKLYLDFNDLNKALLFINDGIAISSANKHIDNLANFYRFKSIVQEKLNNPVAALKAYKEFKSLNDSILNQETIKRQTTLALEFEFKKNEIERQKEKEAILKQKEEKESYYRQLILFIVVIVLIVFSYLFIRNNIIKKANLKIAKANNELQESIRIIAIKNKEIEIALAEREVLLKEIHHRVKNNLQVISSIIDIQTAFVNDESAKSVLLDTQGRISSISLLHNLLYQHEKLSSIQLNTFIENLFNQVFSMYSNQSKSINFNNKLQPLFLTIDIAIPLGLIFNELLTNSFKYAFVNAKSPIISVQLLHLSNNEFVIDYQDNGIGLPVDFNIATTKTTGIKIVRQLCKQLKGKLEYNYNEGSHFKVYFKNL